MSLYEDAASRKQWVTITLSPRRWWPMSPGAVSTAERIAWCSPALAFRTEPALMRPDHLPAVRAVFQVWRDRGLGHPPWVARSERLEHGQSRRLLFRHDQPLSIHLEARRVPCVLCRASNIHTDLSHHRGNIEHDLCLDRTLGNAAGHDRADHRVDAVDQLASCACVRFRPKQTFRAFDGA